jgi:D-alanyl-lipoteichoic acid acyltransferase DltB (MBOAT superfamily)
VASLAANRWLGGTFRRAALLVVSGLFYAAMDLGALVPLGAVVVSSWAGGIAVARRRQGGVLALAIVGVLVPLLATKYWPWLRQALADGSWWDSGALDARPVPPGLSFVSLQAVGYVADVWRRQIAPTKRVADQALFLAFFPQLVAGPIERTGSLRPQLEAASRPTHEDLYGAAKLALWGYTLKLLLADALAGPVDTLLAIKGSSGGGALLLALALFSVRLYFDFLGYSCIAVALGQAHGVRLTFNFAHPYGAAGLREFWRRWHISLSTWWRDYVYIPLGGRRGSVLRQLVALLAAFLLSGLWHGAGLGFLAWGALHGAGLAIERVARGLLERWNTALSRLDGRSARFVGVAVTSGFVTVCWLPFLAGPLHPMATLLERLLSAFRAGSETSRAIAGLVPTLLVPLGLALTGLALERPMQRWWRAVPPTGRAGIARDLALTNAMVIGLLLFGDFGGRSFIYFAF